MSGLCRYPRKPRIKVRLSSEEVTVGFPSLPVETYQRVFEQSPLGMIIYCWEEPPALGSFRMVAQNEAAIEAGGLRRDLLVRLDEVDSPLLQSEIPGRYAQVLIS